MEAFFCQKGPILEEMETLVPLAGQGANQEVMTISPCSGQQ